MKLIPQITVIVPVYKIKHEYLIKCLESLSNQTVDKSLYEVIIVDDNNNEDDCGKICDEYGAKNKNFRIFHQVNQGVSVARNLGIVESNAPYIAFVDADDWVELDMIEVMLNAQKECSDADLWSFSYFNNYKYEQKKIQVIEKKSEIIEHENISDLQLLLIHFRNCRNLKNILFQGHPWSKLYKKNLILSNNLFFNKKIKKSQDILFNLYYVNLCKRVSLINIAFYHYNINKSSVCNTQNSKIIMYHEQTNSALNSFVYEKNDILFNKAKYVFIFTNSFLVSYELYFKYNFWTKRLEYKNFINSKDYYESIKNVNYSDISYQHRILLFATKTKSLFLLKICDVLLKLFKRCVRRKKIIND